MSEEGGNVPRLPGHGKKKEDGRMAQKIQVILIDDTDGSAADETVRFGLDGVNYEIDLTAENAAKLRDALAPWVANARRAGGRRTTQRGGGGRSSSSDASRVREWARANGYTVSDRGRIPAEVREAYEAATKA